MSINGTHLVWLTFCLVFCNLSWVSNQFLTPDIHILWLRCVDNGEIHLLISVTMWDFALILVVGLALTFVVSKTKFYQNVYS